MRNSKNKWSDSADKVMMHDHNMFDDSIKHVSGFGWTKSPLDTPFDSFTDDLYQWGNSGGCVSVILFINSRFPCLCNAGLIPYMYVHWLPFKKGLWRHVSVDKLLAKCFHTASVDQPLTMAKKVRLFTELPYSITIQWYVWLMSIKLVFDGRKIAQTSQQWCPHHFKTNVEIFWEIKSKDNIIILICHKLFIIFSLLYHLCIISKSTP